MPLETQHLIIDMVGRKRAELAGRKHRRVLGQRGDLILMADQQRERVHRRRHPRPGGGQLIMVNADTPALHGTLGPAAQQQGQQLVTEADTQQFFSALIQLQQVDLQGLNPRVGAK